MEKYFQADRQIQTVKNRINSWRAPTGESASTTHGGFDDDETTMRTIIELVKDAP